MSDATLIAELADCRQCYDTLATKHATLLVQLDTERALVTEASREASRTIAELHKQVSELRAACESALTMCRNLPMVAPRVDASAVVWKLHDALDKSAT